ncbi:MAG: fatty-acyl-CoA synthase [Rhodobacteraceae bacterium HLUCCA12]|nr:MAG: fatty-acyl-CoA synthase [Rhodobacteraceae bacterium HLUCCA12]
MSILNESLAGRLSAPFATGPAMSGREELAPRDGRSYVAGSRDRPLRHVTIPRLLRETVARYGPRDAAIFRAQGERLSWYDLDRRVDALAAGLLALGLGKGDRVGIWSPNRVEWLLTQFATARIGAILVNINPAYQRAELEFALNKVGCAALVLAERFKASEYLRMLRDLAPEMERAEPGRLTAARLPHLRAVAVMSDDPGPGAFSFDALTRLGGPAQQLRLEAVDATLDPDDAINIQFTSGTTGAPKGATLSHFNIVNNAGFVTDRIRLSETDRLCIPVPLYHCFGMVMGVLGCVDKGAAMVFPGEGFEAGATLDAVAAERCTALYGVPTMFTAMLEHQTAHPRDLGALRTGIMAGAPCPVQVMEDVNNRMNMSEVTICYGMTETAPVSFQSFVDDTVEHRCATVGRVHPHLEVKIIGPDGATVPVGQAGELCTRGYSVMKGYWGDPDLTAAAIRDGWMQTGDLATLDEAGFCRIVGRVKDMIIRGGENIYPREIEEFLYRHPDVAQVQVFGIPDSKLGEVVCAWVVAAPGTSPGEEALKAHCAGQIAHFKIPRHILIVPELPVTVTGKPQKFAMRDKMIEWGYSDRPAAG